MVSKTNHSLQMTCTLILLIKLLIISQQLLSLWKIFHNLFATSLFQEFLSFLLRFYLYFPILGNKMLHNSLLASAASILQPILNYDNYPILGNNIIHNYLLASGVWILQPISNHNKCP